MIDGPSLSFWMLLAKKTKLYKTLKLAIFSHVEQNSAQKNNSVNNIRMVLLESSKLYLYL